MDVEIHTPFPTFPWSPYSILFPATHPFSHFFALMGGGCFTLRSLMIPGYWVFPQQDDPWKTISPHGTHGASPLWNKNKIILYTTLHIIKNMFTYSILFLFHILFYSILCRWACWLPFFFCFAAAPPMISTQNIFSPFFFFSVN